MSEADYINVSDLQRVRIAPEILLMLTTCDGFAVDKDEHSKVIQLLQKWEAELFVRLPDEEEGIGSDAVLNALEKRIEEYLEEVKRRYVETGSKFASGEIVATTDCLWMVRDARAAMKTEEVLTLGDVAQPRLEGGCGVPCDPSSGCSSPSSCSQVCRVCGGKLKKGIALIPGIYGSEDFGGDFGQAGTTMSEGPGDGKPRQCLKCEKCGHSFIQANVERSDRHE